VVLAFGDRAEYVAQPKNEPTYAPPRMQGPVLILAQIHKACRDNLDPDAFYSLKYAQSREHRGEGHGSLEVDSQTRAGVLLFFFYPNSFFSVLDGILY
jgi:hypothetical protein